MILGSEHVYFVDNSLRQNQNIQEGADFFKYQKIRKIKCYKERRDYFKLELFGGQEPMNIISEDAPNLIMSLKCYW